MFKSSTESGAGFSADAIFCLFNITENVSNERFCACTEMILNLVMSDSCLMEADNRPRELLDRLLYASAVI